MHHPDIIIVVVIINYYYILTLFLLLLLLLDSAGARIGSGGRVVEVRSKFASLLWLLCIHHYYYC